MTRVVAGERAGDVLDRLAAVDADLVGPDGDRVAAELHDRHLAWSAGCGATASRRAAPTPWPASTCGRVGVAGQVEHRAQLVGG